MKATGIVRKVDELGRIVIPKEIRRTMHIKHKTPLELYVDDDSIVFKKYEPACVFCHSTDDLCIVHGKSVCVECANKIAESFSGKSHMK